MIFTPRLSQLPFDVIIKGSIGYGLGKLSRVDKRLAAAVLSISSIVNAILFEIGDRWIGPKLKISSRAVYTGTNALTSIITVLTAQQLDLISRRFAIVAVCGCLAVLAARLKILAKE